MTQWDRSTILAGLWQDVRYGMRTLRVSPGFTAVATITIALGIGATTAIFSVFDAMLLRPLRADPARRVVQLQLTGVRKGEARGASRLWDYVPSLTSMRDWQQRRELFEAIGAWDSDVLTLLDVDPVERVDAVAVTPQIFAVFDARPPAVGRLFTDADADAPVAVISYAAWQRRFGGAADIVGRSVRAVDMTRTIVGVLPQEFGFQPSSDFWVPLPSMPRTASYGWGGDMLARLRPGVTVRQAQQAMAGEPPPPGGTRGAVIDPGVAVRSLHEEMVRYSRQMLYALLGAVACILLIASLNVAGLLIARGSGRGREVAIRAALGAHRGRLIRQFLIESLLLAVLGGTCGIALAWWLLEALIGVLPVNVPVEMSPVVDLRLLAFTALIITGTGLALGLVPAIRLSRTDLSTATKTGGLINTGSSGRTGRVLVAVEVALALTLLVGAGLMLRSLQRLLSIDSGFDAEHVLVVEVSPVLPVSDTAANASRADAFYGEVVRRLTALPDVAAVSAISSMPFLSYGAAIATVDAPTPTNLQVSQRYILPGYFEAMGITLRAGREFTGDDRVGHQCVAIINEMFVRRTALGPSPLGRRVKIREAAEWCEIVGVAADVRHVSLESESFAELYLSARHTPQPELTVVIRSHDSGSLAAAVRAQLVNLPERTLIASVRPFGAVVGSSTEDRRNRALLLSIVGALGLLLACVGIFGLTAYAVTRRTREIGVRVALGATPAGVIRTIVGSFVPAIAGGLGLGLFGAWVATRVIEQFLFGVEPHDPVTLLTVTGLLAMLAALACYLPARRALRVDPVVALRAE